MSPPEGEPTTPDVLPDDLVETVDGLGDRALRQLSAYVTQRLTELNPPIAEIIREETDEEIISIEDRGAYTLVRKRLPSQNDREVNPQTVSVYHVSRESQLDGELTLRWSYIGEANDSG